jgi:hypothetical protein
VPKLSIYYWRGYGSFIPRLLSFEDLQQEMDCSLLQMFKMASHLVYWKKAKIIDPISVNNVYVISPDYDSLEKYVDQDGVRVDSIILTPDVTSLEATISDFQAIFPIFNLASFLSKLSQAPRRLASLLPSKSEDSRTLFFEIITFLLRRNCIVQFHTYLYMLIPQYIKYGITRDEYDAIFLRPSTDTSNEQNGFQQQEFVPNMFGTGFAENTQDAELSGGLLSLQLQQHDMSQPTAKNLDIFDPSQATEIELQYLEQLAATQDPRVAAIFMRCVSNENSCAQDVFILIDCLAAKTLSLFKWPIPPGGNYVARGNFSQGHSVGDGQIQARTSSLSALSAVA